MLIPYWQLSPNSLPQRGAYRGRFYSWGESQTQQHEGEMLRQLYLRPKPKITPRGSVSPSSSRYLCGRNKLGSSQSRKMALKGVYVSERALNRDIIGNFSQNVGEHRSSLWDVEGSVEIVLHKSMGHPQRHHGVQP